MGAGATALLDTPGPRQLPVLRRVTTPAPPEDMLLRNGEVQYVCRNALDNRTIDQFAALAAVAGFSGRLKSAAGVTT
jgi:hypothetical protein